MHTNRIKAKVDFKFCLGSIPAMLRATKPVLSERQYKELCNEVNKANGYLEQKRIIFRRRSNIQGLKIQQMKISGQAV